MSQSEEKEAQISPSCWPMGPCGTGSHWKWKSQPGIFARARLVNATRKPENTRTEI